MDIGRIVDDVSSRVFVESSHFSQESMIDNHIRCWFLILVKKQTNQKTPQINVKKIVYTGAYHIS